jgi:KRAB domain-containing zinc finger protein
MCLKHFPSKMKLQQHLRSCIKTGWKLKVMVQRLSEEEILALSKPHSQSLQSHDPTSIPGKIKCSFKNCTLIFSSLEDFTEHKETHYQALKFSCELCCKRFPNKSLLDRHLQRTHSQVRSHPCDVPGCSYSGKDSLYLLQHKNSVHNAILNTCPMCYKIIKDHYFFKLHVAKHNTETPGVFKCLFKMCIQLFQSGDDLRKHAKEAHYSNAKKFQCNECGNFVSSKQYLRTHLQMHWNQSALKCDTEGCSYSTNRSNALKWHKNHFHTLKRFTCCHCGKSIKARISFKKHLEKHETSDTPGVFKCHHVDCHETFSVPSDLRTHMKQHVELHECDVPGCSFTSKLNNAMQLHRQNVHSIWPHSCQVCSKSFFAERFLKLHMIDHETRKPEDLKEDDVVCKDEIEEA